MKTLTLITYLLIGSLSFVIAMVTNDALTLASFTMSTIAAFAFFGMQYIKIIHQRQ